MAATIRNGCDTSSRLVLHWFTDWWFRIPNSLKIRTSYLNSIFTKSMHSKVGWNRQKINSQKNIYLNFKVKLPDDYSSDFQSENWLKYYNSKQSQFQIRTSRKQRFVFRGCLCVYKSQSITITRELLINQCQCVNNSCCCVAY